MCYWIASRHAVAGVLWNTELQSATMDKKTPLRHTPKEWPMKMRLQAAYAWVTGSLVKLLWWRLWASLSCPIHGVMGELGQGFSPDPTFSGATATCCLEEGLHTWLIVELIKVENICGLWLSTVHIYFTYINITL